MWVLFAPDAATDPLWQTLEENEFFELQAYKPATSSKPESSLLSMLTALPSSLLATSRTPSLIGSVTEENFPYRILLKTQPPYGQRSAAKQSKESKDSSSMDIVPVGDSSSSRSPAQVIALAKDLRVIKEHWNWLINDMSTACSFFTRESEKEENELWDFLLMKFTSMAQQEAKKREMQREREREKVMERERQIEIASFVDNRPKYVKKQANIMINEEEEEDSKAKEKRFEEMDQARQALWKKLFPKISTIERLIVEYPCSLERKGVERRGLLLVTPRHVCFHSPRLNTRVAIYWRVITSLSRATAVSGTIPAIYVTCLGAYHEEFLFHSLADFEQTMNLLVRIWHMALLEEAADRDGDEEAKARLMSITREQLLCEIERDKHRKIFRMPKDEMLIAEFCGSLWMENVIQVYEGTLYISTNYVCFHADVEGHNFSVVIPFREVLDIISVDSKLIQVNSQSNKFSFSLLWRRQHCCELMVQLWSRRIRSTERLLEKIPPAEGPWEDFGFVGLGPIVKDNKQFRSDYAIKQKLQRKRWEEYVSKHGWGIQMLKTSDVLRDIVRYGIPDELKGGLWQVFLGSAHSLCIKPGEYQNILKSFDGKNSDAISEIERDVNRSFPEHPYFQSEKGKQALRNVLIAYSWRNPSLGYCQSMNIICSLLLLFMREEETFWALTILCEELFPQYFTPDMLGSMTDQHVLEDLVAEHFPKLNTHLESIQLPLVLISFPWFMCLFIGYIPMQTSIRILDILFCEGYDSTFIFKVALAVFKYNQKFILNTRDFSKLVIQLKFTNLDCETLLEITEDFWWVTSKLINEMRDYHRFQLLKESKTPMPPLTSPSGGSAPMSTRSTSAPTHFPRAPSTPVQTPTPTPSSSPPLPAYMTTPIRTRSDSSLFATVKVPFGPMSVPDNTTGSLTTIPFLTSVDVSVAQPPSSAPASYLAPGKGPSPSATPRKVQFDGTTIPFVGGSDEKIMSALTRLSSKERLGSRRPDEDESTDATASEEDDDSTSMEEESTEDEDTDDVSTDDTVSSAEVSESDTKGTTAEGAKEAEETRSARRKARREQLLQEAEREHVFHMELDKPPLTPKDGQVGGGGGEGASADDAAPAPTPTAGASADPHGSGATSQPDEHVDNNAATGGNVDSNIKNNGSSVASPRGTSKSEPSTPIRVTHSDDVLDANDAEKEKRRKRKIKSRRRRMTSLGRARSRKSRERVGTVAASSSSSSAAGKAKGKEKLTADDEAEEEAEEREKRIVRLDLDLNLAWRKEDRGDGNKGVKYLQRFLFKKRRRHSDGYLDIIKEDESGLTSPRLLKTGDDSTEPSVTHRRFFVEEDEGEEREPTSELETPDSGRRERRRSHTEGLLTPRADAGTSTRATNDSPPPSTSSLLSPTPSSSSSGSSERTTELSPTPSAGGLKASRQQLSHHHHQHQTPENGERKEKEKEKEKEEESEGDSNSETDESERDDELKSSVFVTSNTTLLPRTRRTKKVRERRASVANLLKKEPSGRLLDHAGAFVERKRAELLEEEYLLRNAGASVAAAAATAAASAAAADGKHGGGGGLLDHLTTPLKRSKETSGDSHVDTNAGAVPPVVMKATVTPGGRSPPLLPKIEELREDLTSSADEDSGSDADPSRDGSSVLGTSPEGGKRKKIRSKLRNSRHLSTSEPNLATSPPTQPHHHHRGRSKGHITLAQPAEEIRSDDDDEEEWERTSSPGDGVNGMDRKNSRNDDDSDRSSGDEDNNRTPRGNGRGEGLGSDGSDNDVDSGGNTDDGVRRPSEDGGERGEGGSRRRTKFFKYPVDILSKTKQDLKRLDERRKEERRDKDRTKEEEKEKRKKERMDEKEARRRSKGEGKERRKIVMSGSDNRGGADAAKWDSQGRESEIDSEKKRRHKEEKEMRRRKEEEERESRRKKEEEERESRRKRKEEEKEKKKQHKMEKEMHEREKKRTSASSHHNKDKDKDRDRDSNRERTEHKDTSSDERDVDRDSRDGGGKEGGRDKQHKKAFGLLPLPHISHHGHSLSFHLPSSPRRNTTGTPAPASPHNNSSNSSSGSNAFKTPPSPRHMPPPLSPVSFNRAPSPPPDSPRKHQVAAVHRESLSSPAGGVGFLGGVDMNVSTGKLSTSTSRSASSSDGSTTP